MISRREASAGILSAAIVAGTAGLARAQEPKTVQLPPPRMDGGKPLMQALKLRRSTREYADHPLPPEVLSDLLWAALGINRPSGDRTSPYWRRIQVIDVYAAMADGVWLYDPKAHALLQHSPNDIRAKTGQQPYVGSAALNLIYVAHGERMPDIPAEGRRLFASVDSGFIGQNVYLYCASEGLACVFRGAIDHKALGEELKLGTGQFVTFAQSVGYPKS